MSSILSVETGSCAEKKGPYRHLHQLLNPGPELDLLSVNTHERTEVEQYIAKQFQTAYGADIQDFLPLLFSLRCNNTLSAATGICRAGSRPLFIEQYLDSSIENEINHLSSQYVHRSSIAEIGNLAGTQRGSSQLLFIILASILHQVNVKWIVFTATPQVQRMIGKLGLQLHPLKEASPLCLSQSSIQNWGSYYDTKPMVVAGQLDEAIELIHNRQILKGMLSLYKNRIDTLASVIHHQNNRNDYDQYYFAA